MKLFVIFGQNKENYPGQFGPEALDCADEYTNDENPDYLIEKMQEHQKNSRFENVEVIAIEVDQSAIMRILRPQSPNTIQGKVL